MENITQYLKKIDSRNSLLSDDLKKLQQKLQIVLNQNITEAGVINPGYFSYFLPVLEECRLNKIISRYQIGEEH